ncbi:hypothetical protein A6V39_04940 [Candidatus Mycoplasma haematobovis]|uniref:ABC3 transporter permease C-terminal domain-containing protein n=1 Tax=Candidatus Mycoplasma haematobovis TaxID=432608 RepID=A0A1A9QCC3_9MOLU|nr:ABC transporter permease [Candidatus Mycoplasma haematobovis]OAL09888.1 hypothetical protein A6V39_04940 [Candidatus Mycoplasma haematobovis]
MTIPIGDASDPKNYGYANANANLICWTSDTFLQNYTKEVSFLDRNKASLILTGNPREDVFEEADLKSVNILENCGYDKTAHKHTNNFNTYFANLVGYFKEIISTDKDKGNQDQNGRILTAEEIYEAHEKKAFNPKYFFRSHQNGGRDEKAIFSFRQLFEKDYFLEFNISFKNKIGAKEITNDFQILIDSIRATPQYYKLDEQTRQSIDIFRRSDIFKQIPTKFYVSSFSKVVDEFEAWIPMVPGLSYSESLILLIKLMLWDHIKDATYSKDWWKNKQEPTKELKELFDEAKAKAKDNLNKLIDSNIKDIKQHDPFKFPTESSTSQELGDYLFSTVRGTDSISTLKNTDQAWQKLSGCDTNFESGTLASVWKSIINKWIDGDYNKDNKCTISAYSKDSAPTNFKPQPDSFDLVYQKLKEALQQAIKQHLILIEINNLSIVKKFINNYNLFTLSFLLYNFKYEYPSTILDDRKTSIRLASAPTYSIQTQRAEEQDWSISSQYHKSVVVTNPANISSKLNDTSKTGHSFKVITREVKDDSSLNRMKIISGNDLFTSPQDNIEVIKRINTLQSPDPNKMVVSHMYADTFKLLARAKYSKPEYSHLFQQVYRYYSTSIPDTWKKGIFFSWNEMQKIEKYIWQLMAYARELKTEGSRAILEFTDYEIINFTKTWRLQHNTYTFQSLGYIDQFTSAFGLVSPEYAKKNNIVPITQEDYDKFKDLIQDEFLTQEDWEKEYHAFLMNPKNADSIVNINGNKIIVVGTALSPDFLLPTHTFLNLVPNTDREGLIYMDNYGYQNIAYNCLSSWNEYYLSLAYPQAVKDYGLEEDYYRQLREYIDKFLTPSTEIKVSSDTLDYELKKVSDTPSTPSLVYLRSNYVNGFTNAVDLVSYILLGIVGSIIFFTVWTLIKKYINSSLNTFGIFVANGIPRKEIVTTSFSFIFFPAVVGVTLGYFGSLIFQPAIFSLLSNIWYLDPIFNSFNLSKFINYLITIVGVLIPISFIPSFKLLRPNVGNLMKTSSMFRSNAFIDFFNRLLRQTSSVWKFRFSVILNTINRGLILVVASVFLFLFSSFLFNNMGQFSRVSQYELASKNYGFEMDFQTPSEQSGQFFLSSYKNLGNTFLNRIPQVKRVIQKINGSSPTDPKFEIKEIKISKDNPEVISSGIVSPFHYNDLAEFLEKCPNEDIEALYKKLGVMDLDFPSKLITENAYNVYLLKSTLKSKNNGASNTCDLSQYTTEGFAMRNVKHLDGQIFSSSTKEAIEAIKDLQQEKEKVFNPTDDSENLKDFQLSDYVPVEGEIWNKSTKPDEQQQQQQQMLKYDNEPLFKPLIDAYKDKKDFPTISKNSKHSGISGAPQSWNFHDVFNGTNTVRPSSGNVKNENSKVEGDFRTFQDKDSQKNYHPTLSRLFRDHSNYWLFTHKDVEFVQKDPFFFKNKVVVSLLLNHDWNFNLFGKSVQINPWKEFSDYFSKYSPEMVDAMDKNYLDFVEAIIKSRYGEFFVKRFMTRHKQLGNNAKDDIVPGTVISGKKSWSVKHSKMKPTFRDKVIEGTYYLDPSKLIYFYDKLQMSSDETADASKQTEEERKHPDRLIIFRPDFLYLFYALLNDPEFLTPEIAPVKIAFHQNLYAVDYSKQYTEDWQVTGDVQADSKYGLTSSSTSPNYEATPNGDQTYTYLQGSLNDLKGLKVYGLKQDSRGSYIKLTRDGENINKKLYLEKEGDIYPVIINHYTAKRSNLSVGSTFKFKVQNTYDRFTKQMNDNKELKEVTFKVVDIFDSYYQTALYTSQQYANEILGLDSDYGYNGIITKKFTDSKALPFQFTKGVSGFSPSGIYTKININKSGDKFLTFLKNNGFDNAKLRDSKFVQPQNYEAFKLKYNLQKVSKPEDLANQLEKVYGKGFSLQPAISNVNNMSVFNDFVFSTVSDLVLSVINLFMSILAPLLVCSLLVITILIIEDLKNLLTILNLLGFSYVENSMTILLYLGLIFGFSVLIAVPVTQALLAMYVDKVFNAVSIFLPIYLRPDYAIASCFMLLGMFGFSYFRSMKKIKSLYLPVAMKSLNE